MGRPADGQSLAGPPHDACDRAVRAKIDESILAYMQANAKKYFGSSATKEKAAEWFRPTVKEHEEGKYAPLVKTKLSKSRVKVWTPAREAGSVRGIRRVAPEAGSRCEHRQRTATRAESPRRSD